MRKVFILVPSPHPTGPIKGAYALANALAPLREVTLVTLKAGPGSDTPLDPRVRYLSLATTRGGWRGRIAAYRALLQQAGGRAGVASISMCLSADLVNRFCRPQAVTCASVRGNLVQNYRMDYGIPGVAAAVGHLAALHAFDHIVAISAAMSAQVARFARQMPTVIGNFVDEPLLDPYRANAPTGPLTFVFLGSLTRRKHPVAAIRGLGALRQLGVDATLDVIGAGALEKEVAAESSRLGLDEHVRLHGQLAEPYPIVARADAMVLPSLAEGIPRAALEALHLGVPCVLREADGNAELIRPGVNGALFRGDGALAEAMRQAAALSRATPGARTSLLPAAFRQHDAARRYLDLVEQHQ